MESRKDGSISSFEIPRQSFQPVNTKTGQDVRCSSCTRNQRLYRSQRERVVEQEGHTPVQGGVVQRDDRKRGGAEELSVAAMKARKKLLGPEHEDTLRSMEM